MTTTIHQPSVHERTAFWKGLLSPLIAVYFVFLILLRGWVISQLWFWFIVPVFNIQPLRVVAAIGLSLFVTNIIPSTNSDKKQSWSELVQKSVGSIINAVFTLLMGWTISWFM